MDTDKVRKQLLESLTVAGNQTSEAYGKALDKSKALHKRLTNTYGDVASSCETLSDSIQRSPKGTTKRALSGVAGVLGGFGVTNALFSLAATVGTASTGTSIAALSGAAATSASLAWLGGSVLIGGAVVGGASFIGGKKIASLYRQHVQHHLFEQYRPQEDLSDREKRVLDVCYQLSAGCRRMQQEGHEISPVAARTLSEQTISPLLGEIKKERPNYKTWRFGDQKNMDWAIWKLEQLQRKLRRICRDSPVLTPTILGLAITSILQGDFADLTPESELVIEALRRSSKALNDATEAEISAYLSAMSDTQLEGLLNNVKGIYHEMLFAAHENADGDQFTAALFEETNYQGADILLTDTVTGEVTAVQLKATQYLSYVQEHQEKYPDIPVYATNEVAGGSNTVESSGYSDAELTQEVDETIRSLRDADTLPVDDAIATSSLIALCFQCGRILSEQDTTRTEAVKEITDTAKVAMLTGLAAWALS